MVLRRKKFQQDVKEAAEERGWGARKGIKVYRIDVDKKLKGLEQGYGI